MSTPLAIIGGGTMAEAITRGAAHILGPHFVVADPSPERRAAFPNSVETAADAIAWLRDHETADNPGQILLAVKPQMLPTVAIDLRPALDDGSWGRDRVVISILAGASAFRVAAACDGRARVIRVMPNTPALIGRAMSALAIAPSATPADADFARSLFQSIGTVIDLDEPLFDAFTAVAGSGPAYLFLLAESMLQGAIAAGLSESDAMLAVRETLAGAALLLASTSDHPSLLRQRVTSKGGTTAAALEVLAQTDMPSAMTRAILAARDRGRELDRAASSTTIA